MFRFELPLVGPGARPGLDCCLGMVVRGLAPSHFVHGARECFCHPEDGRETALPAVQQSLSRGSLEGSGTETPCQTRMHWPKLQSTPMAPASGMAGISVAGTA